MPTRFQPRRLLRDLLPSRPRADKPLRHLRVAAVVDEFTRASLAPEVQLWPLHARTWRLQLTAARPHFLFVESTWRGAADSWRYKVARYERRDDDTLAAVLAHCRKRDIPTVFWNKEDPVHFDRFAHVAAAFDRVFTTDANMVERYQRDCGKAPDAVAPLLFAVQPDLYHPPAAGAAREDRVVFAGSYGEAHFPERRAALEMLLDAAADTDLHIFDRNAHLKASDKAFPPRFSPYLRGALDYHALADEYRRAKVALNVNSVADSPTMLSRRVFEMLACGTAVVSTPSPAIAALFPDIVALTATEAEARTAIHRFLEDDTHRSATARRGIDTVLAHHTYEHRLRKVCAAVHLRDFPP